MPVAYCLTSRCILVASAGFHWGILGVMNVTASSTGLQSLCQRGDAETLTRSTGVSLFINVSNLWFPFYPLVGWLGIFSLIGFLPDQTLADKEDSLSKFAVVEQPWQQKGRCGPNSLVLFLQLHGRNVAPIEVLKSVPLSNRGASLQALKEQSIYFGVSAEVVRATRGALDSIPLPAIAHIGQGFKEHYVLLCEVGKEHVVIVDGTSLSVERQERTVFEKEWSGHLLVHPDWSATALQAAVLVLGIFCVLTAFVCWRSGFGFQGVRSRQSVSEVARSCLSIHRDG